MGVIIMAKLETEYEFKGDVEAVFKGIGKYEKYAEYLPGISNIEVLPAKLPKSKCQVKFDVNLIKQFYYIVDMFEENKKRIWWTLSESNLMKENSGEWVFESLGKDKTKAVYSLEVKFKGLIPSAITDQVAKANLPAMMEGFQKIINSGKKAKSQS